VCSSVCEVPLCLFVCVWVGDVSGIIKEGGEDGFVLAGEVGAECGGYGVGEAKGGIQ
jgi:hypothetical protein